jgi:hypothetical protein
MSVDKFSSRNKHLLEGNHSRAERMSFENCYLLPRFGMRV